MSEMNTVMSGQLLTPQDGIIQLSLELPYLCEENNWTPLVKTLRQQVRVGRLHSRAVFAGKTIGKWLTTDFSMMPTELAADTCSNLHAALDHENISDELADIIADWSSRDLNIFVSRFGLRRQTLQEVGDRWGVTRERIRQISNRKMKYVASRLTSRPYLRIQSAIALAKDKGSGITYTGWVSEIKKSGLLGKWRKEHNIADLGEINSVDLFVAICSSQIGITKLSEFSLPENLGLTLGKDISARVIKLIPNLPLEKKKSLFKQARNGGAVSLAHTTKLIAVEDDDARQVLKGLGFTCVTSNWYVPFEDISRQFQMRDRTWAAFHTVLRMLRFCGQLNLNEVHLGLSKHAERLKYDVPPVDVLHRILEMYGFTIDEGRVAWKHDNPSALSGGEELIFRELKSYGGIVGYFELVQAFENAGKSLPALSKTLAYSALFKKAAIGLYILRGTSVTELEIQKAKERQPQTVSNTEITFDLSGEVVFRLNLGSLTISTGVIYAPCLQYLSGTWYVELDGQVYGNLKISDHQLWGLGKVLRAMHLQVGDRVELRFDTWSRAVKLNRFRNGFIEAN